jgi:hypothetical protein
LSEARPTPVLAPKYATVFVIVVVIDSGSGIDEKNLKIRCRRFSSVLQVSVSASRVWRRMCFYRNSMSLIVDVS